jgi:prepilin-type N-terminal cleavage/methylation domain-containing protein
MSLRLNYRCRGITLVELTVVLVILSLLAVAVLPALNRNPNESLMRDTASTVQGHIAQGVSKSIGSRTGYGVWLNATGVSGSANLVNTLAFCPGMTTSTGSSQLSTLSYTATTATLTPGVPITVLGSAGSTFPAGTLISFTGYPYEYLLNPAGTVASFRSDAMQTAYNTTFPHNSGTTSGSNPAYSWVVSVPPTRAMGTKAVLRGNACIDLGCSSVGVGNYSNVSAEIPTAPLRITFDSTGQAQAVIYAPVGGSQKFRRLDPETPVALLIGMASQVGAGWVTSAPTDDEPGSNLQRPDAFWVVYDPRSSTSFIVENYVANPGQASKAPSRIAQGISNAQKFVRQALLNRLDAN